MQPQPHCQDCAQPLLQARKGAGGAKGVTVVTKAGKGATGMPFGMGGGSAGAASKAKVKMKATAGSTNRFAQAKQAVAGFGASYGDLL